MSLTSEVVYKSNGVRVAGDATSMQLEGPATVKLGVDPQSVLRFERAGDDLVMVLKDGRKVTVSDFFAVDAQGQGSDLVLQGQDGVSWLGERTGTGADFHFTQLPAEAAPVAAAAGAGGSSMPWVLAGLGGAGALALAGGGGGGGDDSPAPPAPPAPAVNNPPTATAVPLTTAEDTLGTGRITASDPDGNTLTYRVATGPAQGSVTVDAGTGAYNYTPKANYHGEDSFAIAVEDGKGGSTTVTVKVTVTPVNDAPYGMETRHNGLEDLSFSASVDTHDPDGDTLVYSLATGPEHGTVVVNADGTYVYTPAANYHGTDTFTLRADDGYGGTSMNKVTITLAPANDAPTAQADSRSVDEDTTVAGSVTAVDLDGDRLTYRISVEPLHGSVMLDVDTGTYLYTPHKDYFGPDRFTVEVSDGQGGTAEVTIPVTVNPIEDAPVTSDVSLTTAEDTSVIGPILAMDPDGDAVSWALQSWPRNGTFGFRPDGTFIYVPQKDFHGTDVFKLQISDGKGGVATSTVTVTVTPVNDAPWIFEGRILHAVAGTPLADKVIAIDFDGDAMTYQLASTSPDTTVGQVELSADGTVLYTPAPGFTGTDRFRVTVTDSHGAASDGWITVEVAPPNQAPLVVVNDPLVVNEDSSKWGSITFSDPEGNYIVYRIVTPPGHGEAMLSSVPGPLQYHYKPDANYNGPDSFVVEASDGKGGITTATVSITVLPVNDPPSLPALVFATDEDTPISGLLVGTDVDGDTLTYQLPPVPTGTTAGHVDLAADGAFTYTPAQDYHGNDRFLVTITDSNGFAVDKWVSVPVAPVNDAPEVTWNEPMIASEDIAMSGTVVVRDIDGDRLSYRVLTPPSHGTLTYDPAAGPSFYYVYTPSPEFSGQDTFTIEASDGNGGFATATVPITVRPVNDVPIMPALHTATTIEDTVLAGRLLVTDVDGPTTIYQLLPGDLSQGSLQLDLDGSYRYTPAANFNGTAEFRIRVSDGISAFVETVLSITVTPVNDHPRIISASTVDTLEGVDASGHILAMDVDGPGPITYSVLVSPEHGSVTISDPESGYYTYRPDPYYHGTDSFIIIARDAADGWTTMTIPVTVQPVNDQPTIADYAFTIDENSSLSDQVAGSDVDGDILTYSLNGVAHEGDVIVRPDGTFTYTPAADFTGTDSFKVVVEDGHGGLAISTVEVNVLPVSDALGVGVAALQGVVVPAALESTPASGSGAGSPDATVPSLQDLFSTHDQGRSLESLFASEHVGYSSPVPGADHPQEFLASLLHVTAPISELDPHHPTTLI